jgi:hypothetical protein
MEFQITKKDLSSHKMGLYPMKKSQTSFTYELVQKLISLTNLIYP